MSMQSGSGKKRDMEKSRSASPEEERLSCLEIGSTKGSSDSEQILLSEDDDYTEENRQNLEVESTLVVQRRQIGVLGDATRIGHVDYRLQLFRQKNNRYTSASTGPFVVQVYDKDPRKNLGDYNVMLIRKRLRELNIRIKGTNDYGKEQVVVQFDTWEEANVFVEGGFLKLGNNCLVLIPNSSVYDYTGFNYDIPKDFNEEDIWDGLDDKSKRIIKKIEILKKRVPVKGKHGSEAQPKGYEYEYTGSMKLYSLVKLPLAVYIYRALKLVNAYTPAFRRCSRCQRYGHIAAYCSHYTRCTSLTVKFHHTGK